MFCYVLPIVIVVENCPVLFSSLKLSNVKLSIIEIVNWYMIMICWFSRYLFIHTTIIYYSFQAWSDAKPICENCQWSSADFFGLFWAIVYRPVQLFLVLFAHFCDSNPWNQNQTFNLVSTLAAITSHQSTDFEFFWWNLAWPGRWRRGRLWRPRPIAGGTLWVQSQLTTILCKGCWFDVSWLLLLWCIMNIHDTSTSSWYYLILYDIALYIVKHRSCFLFQQQSLGCQAAAVDRLSEVSSLRSDPTVLQRRADMARQIYT